ncbi:hypothetical protein [Kitasatospora sp. NBC_01287]|uniref:hypothetical protein n=1 Tax=Kitasatospora sp. NBC_01287 TaxID=2903573 RepID=UPI00338FA517
MVNASVERLSNGLIESIKTKTRLIIRRGLGFRTADAVITLVMLTLGGERPTPPGRQLPPTYPAHQSEEPDFSCCRHVRQSGATSPDGPRYSTK